MDNKTINRLFRDLYSKKNRSHNNWIIFLEQLASEGEIVYNQITGLTKDNWYPH